MSKYLIRLKPLGEFFFGSEKGFKDEKRDDFTDSEEITYLLKSRQFPQQTAILGMLRQEILMSNDEFKLKPFGEYCDSNLKEMCKLIGKESFDIEKEEQTFGLIKKISPLFIFRSEKNGDISKKNFYIKTPKDHKEGNEKYAPFKTGPKIKTIFGTINGFAQEEYDPKKGLTDDFVNLETLKITKTDEIFKTFEKVGIDKKSVEDAYYKQYYYRLVEDYEFAFFVDSDFEFKNNIVYLGKEKSVFKMIVQKINNEKVVSYESLFSGLKTDNKIILLSDCYIDEIMNKKMKEKNVEIFSIKSDISFRNLRVDFNKKRLIRIRQKYNFWQKGSIIYILKGKKNDLVEIIQGKKNLYNIGYNHVI